MTVSFYYVFAGAYRGPWLSLWESWQKSVIFD